MGTTRIEVYIESREKVTERSTDYQIKSLQLTQWQPDLCFFFFIPHVRYMKWCDIFACAVKFLWNTRPAV